MWGAGTAWASSKNWILLKTLAYVANLGYIRGSIPKQTQVHSAQRVVQGAWETGAFKTKIKSGTCEHLHLIYYGYYVQKGSQIKLYVPLIYAVIKNVCSTFKF